MSDEPNSQLSKQQLLKKEALEILGNWDSVMKPQGYPPYFEHPEGRQIKPFDPSIKPFDPANAWWLSELCRLVYTPDHKEGNRPWKKIIRFDFLKNTRFEEIHSIHKTGTHAAIYRCHPPGQPDAIYHILCFRGTSRFRQWVLNLSAAPTRWSHKDTRTHETDNKSYVHSGFKILFERIWPLIDPIIADIPGPFIYTGHSLGAALATMASLRKKPAQLYTFGSPRIGNAAFRDQLDHPPHFRITNHHDIVTLLPQSIDQIQPFDFHHCGDFIYLDENNNLLHNPKPEVLANEHWAPDQALTYLKRTFTSPHPPECIRDHSPIQYSRKLSSLAIRKNSVNERAHDENTGHGALLF
ncbi:MAG: lipase family protein [Verrucomicrobiales bacterium]|nr:lipase family protein [Verrucomicrobiales bacterium]